MSRTLESKLKRTFFVASFDATCGISERKAPLRNTVRCWPFVSRPGDNIAWRLIFQLFPRNARRWKFSSLPGGSKPAERPLTSMPRLFLMFMLSRRLTRRPPSPPPMNMALRTARRAEFYSPRAATQIIREISLNKVHSMFEQPVLLRGSWRNSGVAPDPPPSNAVPAEAAAACAHLASLIFLLCASEPTTMGLR